MRHLDEFIIRTRRLLPRGLALCLAVTLALWLPARFARAAPALNVTPTGLSFVAVEGASNPSMQSLTIFSSGSEPLSWFAVSSVTWVQVIPLAGTTPSSALVSANVAGMTAGTYTGTIFFTSNQTGTNKVVFVSLTVTPQTP
ncbi:MAG: hypothetical protein HY574_14140 [candidate division NC10 bacterium]|nr:hypothetical protein [candidate division NC10 bacterium]